MPDLPDLRNTPLHPVIRGSAVNRINFSILREIASLTMTRGRLCEEYERRSNLGGRVRLLNCFAAPSLCSRLWLTAMIEWEGMRVTVAKGSLRVTQGEGFRASAYNKLRLQ